MKTKRQPGAVDELALAVRGARKQQQLTQAQLAVKAQVSRTFVVELEKGHPRAELAKVFNVIAALDLRPVGETLVTKQRAMENRRLRKQSALRRVVRQEPIDRRVRAVVPTKVQERMAFADAGLAMAGHQITDPMLRDIVERSARHAITAEEAIAAARLHVQGR